MAMDFYRRPQLAGTALRYPDFPTIRGAVHRHDPDGVSSSPYFPMASGGDLVIVIDGTTTFTVTLTANPSVQTVISAINASTATGPVTFSSVGLAYDEGGVLHLRTLLRSGSVEVTGTSAVALALGFDLRMGRVLARPGDVKSAGEGRISNFYGSVFPVPGESLNSDSFVRALARLSTNQDVMLADVNRATPHLVKWGTVTSVMDTSGSYSLLEITPNAAFTGVKPSNGLGSLRPGETLTADTIQPFFTLTAADGSASMCRPVGVVRANLLSDLTGAPPYSNAPMSSNAGNIFGLNLRRSEGYAIETILNGRFAYRSGGFGDAAVGDYVEIRHFAGAVVLPWSNAGIRWKVMAVTATTLDLAPLSKAELAECGVSLTDNQPIVCLNDQKGPAENFGSVYLWTGPNSDMPRLVVTPPMQQGDVGSIVWAQVPSSPRTQGHGEGKNNPALSILAQGTPHTDVIVSKGSQSYDSFTDTFTVTNMVIRRKGVRVNFSGTVSAAAAGLIYLTTTGTPTLVYSALSYLPLGTPGIVIARISSTAITHDLRVVGEVVNKVTVGTYGDFPTIDLAYAYSRAVGTLLPIHVMESQASPSAGWVFDTPVIIRGAQPLVALTRTSTVMFNTSEALVLDGLTLPTDFNAAGALVVPSRGVRVRGCWLGTTEYIHSGIYSAADQAKVSSAVAGELSLSSPTYLIPLTGDAYGHSSVVLESLNPGTTLQGAITFNRTGVATPLTLYRDDVAILKGGPASDASSLHFHPHGNQLGGTLHAAADGTTAGFLSAVAQTIGGNKTFNGTDIRFGLLTNGTSPGVLLQSRLHISGRQGSIWLQHDSASAVELNRDQLWLLIGGSTDASTLHYHPHGDQAGGSLHAAADGSTAGFLSATTQTIGGVKTFNSSPVVPTPTGATQAANKGYVDTKADVAALAMNVSAYEALSTTNLRGLVVGGQTLFISTATTDPVWASSFLTEGIGQAPINLTVDTGTLNEPTFAAARLNSTVILACGGGTNFRINRRSGTVWSPCSLGGSHLQAMSIATDYDGAAIPTNRAVAVGFATGGIQASYDGGTATWDYAGSGSGLFGQVNTPAEVVYWYSVVYDFVHGYWVAAGTGQSLSKGYTARIQHFGGTLWQVTYTEHVDANDGMYATAYNNGVILAFGQNGTPGIVCRRSTDGGVSWTTVASAPGPSSYAPATRAALGCGPAGCFAAIGDGAYYVGITTDNGDTWHNTPIILPAGSPTDIYWRNPAFSTLLHRWFAVGWSTNASKSYVLYSSPVL